MNRKRVVIVGGGYAGVEALHILASSGWCDVVLIDAHPYHYLQTDVYSLIANECSIGQVAVELDENILPRNPLLGAEVIWPAG